MKRYKRNKLDKVFTLPSGEELTVGAAIDGATYYFYDFYRGDPDVTYGLICEEIIERLEAPDCYNLREGVDFTEKDVLNEMDKYDWDLALEQQRGNLI